VSASPPKFDRTPPQNIEAERSTLGAMLLNPDAVSTAIEVLRDKGGDVFYLEPHQHIYNAIATLYAANKPCDAVILIGQLQQAGTLDAAGGASYLAELTRAVPTSANVESYAQIVRDCATLRDVIQTGTRLVSQAYAGEMPAETLLDNAEREMLRLSRITSSSSLWGMDHIAADAASRLIESARHHSTITGVATGYKRLDAILGGFQPGDYIILAARPSVGKTAVMLNFLLNAAHSKKRCVVFSLEMSKESLGGRLICAEGQIPARDLVGNGLHYIPVIEAARDRLAVLKLLIDDSPVLGVSELRSAARRAAAQGLDLIAIDYLQLMQGDRRAENRQVAVAGISREIKGIARELGVPVLVLSQLTREADGDGAPRMSMLRESGALEQDADVVLMLAREEATLKLHVKKHRNGATTSDGDPVILHFDRATQRIFDVVNGQVQREEPEALPRRIQVANDFDGDTYREDGDLLPVSPPSVACAPSYDEDDIDFDLGFLTRR